MQHSRPREHSAEGESPNDPEGGHMSPPHESQDKDVVGQGEDGELTSVGLQYIYCLAIAAVLT